MSGVKIEALYTTLNIVVSQNPLWIGGRAAYSNILLKSIPSSGNYSVKNLAATNDCLWSDKTGISL